jgi:hypothetical protein
LAASSAARQLPLGAISIRTGLPYHLKSNKVPNDHFRRLIIFDVMSGLRDIAKGGWHPKGKESGKESSWRSDFKGANTVVSIPFTNAFSSSSDWVQ